MRVARWSRLLLALLIGARVALGAEPAVRTTGFNRKVGRLVISVGIQDLFQPRDRERLTSGFASNVLVHMSLYREQGREPIVEALRGTEIVYDVWDERFHIRRVDSSAGPSVEIVDTAEQAIDRATEFNAFAIADLARLPPGSYRLSVRADLNPLSDEVVREVRRWLSRPPGQGRLAPGDSFFGSFVSIFVNPHIEESDRRVQFFSQPFTVESVR